MRWRAPPPCPNRIVQGVGARPPFPSPSPPFPLPPYIKEGEGKVRPALGVRLDAHIGSYIFYEDLYRSNRTTTYVVPFAIGMLLARDSIVGIFIPISISLLASLFTRSVMLHPATNSLVILLARLIVMSITKRAQRYLSDTRSDKSYSRSMPTQQVPSETPVEHLYNHPVTL